MKAAVKRWYGIIRGNSENLPANKLHTRNLTNEFVASYTNGNGREAIEASDVYLNSSALSANSAQRAISISN